MFCPNEIAWGDVATWFSGLGALSAAVVAVFIARYSARHAEKLEREARNKAASALSVAIHADLTTLAGGLKVLIEYNAKLGETLTVAQFDDLREGVKRINAPALDRFLERIDVFEPHVAGQLLIVFRGVVNIQSAVKTPLLDGAPLTEEIVRSAIQSIAQLARETERWVYDAMDSLTVLALQAGFKMISTDVVKAAIIEAQASPE